MFELNTAIDRWRRSLAAGESLSQADLEEVESHLLEEIDGLMHAGLSQEEAFLIATRRLGDNATLAVEFAKVNVSAVWRRRFFWMIAGIFTFMVAGAMAEFSASLGTVIATYERVPPQAAGVLSTVVKAATLAFFTIVGCRALSGPRTISRMGTPAGLAAILIAAAVAVALVRFTAGLVPALTTRMLGAETYGQMIYAAHFSGMFWTILMPILTAVALIALRRYRHTAYYG